MNDLRWILITCGAALLVAIYLWGRRSDKRSPQEAAIQPRSEPQIEPAFEAPTYRVEDDDPLPIDISDDEAAFDEPAVTHAAARSEFTNWQGDTAASTARPTTVAREGRTVRVEPTLGDGPPPSAPGVSADEFDADPGLTAELPPREPVAAPTLGMSSTPAPRRIERRKIIALRLAAGGQRFPGDALRNALESESLQFGRYDVFHRLHDDGVSIFSIASMVEPGTFELERMPSQQYAGVTMFAQLPGPVGGVHALQDLVTCGKRLQELLGGTLQDERGVPLTVHRIERLRQEVVDFERAQTRDQRSASSPQF